MEDLFKEMLEKNDTDINSSENTPIIAISRGPALKSRRQTLTPSKTNRYKPRASEVFASKQQLGFGAQALERTTEAFRNLNNSPRRRESLARKVLKNSKIVAIRNIYA